MSPYVLGATSVVLTLTIGVLSVIVARDWSQGVPRSSPFAWPSFLLRLGFLWILVFLAMAPFIALTIAIS